MDALFISDLLGIPPAVEIKIGSYTGSRFSRDIGALIDTPENTEDSNRTEDLVSKVGKKANTQLSKNHGVGKESSRRKETGSPRKGVKGKKRGLNREIVTLGGLKKQETALKGN